MRDAPLTGPEMLEKMEATWRAVSEHGGGRPNFVVVPGEWLSPRRSIKRRGKRMVVSAVVVPDRHLMAALRGYTGEIRVEQPIPNYATGTFVRYVGGGW